MTSPVSYRERGSIAIITSDNPPVNALGHAVRQGLADGLARAEASTAVRAVVIICAGRTFFAGADIREFGKPPQSPTLRELHEAMTRCSKLIIAAIHGTALGGGLETALASHYRIAAPTAKVGLPEVNLGIVPGAGGTQRLPRLIGVERALDMIVTGRPIAAPQAKDWGVIDEIADGDLEPAAVAYAGRLVAADAPQRRVGDITIDRKAVPPGFFDAARQRMAREKRGFVAPQKCIDAVEAALSLSFDQGMKRERELFNDCMATPHAKAQRYAFFAEREAVRGAGLDRQGKAGGGVKAGIFGADVIGQRMFQAYIGQAERMLREGASADEIDRALYDFGLAEGPFANSDHARDDGAPGDRPVTLTPDEIVTRCLYATVNEGARLLEEGVALRPGDIDQVWIQGYGFPVYRGGPMFHADMAGLDKVVAKIADYRAAYGEEDWPGAPLLDKLAATGKTFGQWKDEIRHG